MNYYNQILNLIKEKTDIGHVSEIKLSSIFILKHLIEILGEEKFNNIFRMYFIESEGLFDDKFYNFHKSMRQTDFYNIHNGHLDMIFWNFIIASDTPYRTFKKYYELVQILREYDMNIGKKVSKGSIGRKEKNGKPFKSGRLVNTVKDVVMHDFMDVPAYTFEEDDTQVECRRCIVVES